MGKREEVTANLQKPRCRKSWGISLPIGLPNRRGQATVSNRLKTGGGPLVLISNFDPTLAFSLVQIISSTYGYGRLKISNSFVPT